MEAASRPLEEPNKVPGLVAPTTHSAGATEELKKYNILSNLIGTLLQLQAKNGLGTAIAA